MSALQFTSALIGQLISWPVAVLVAVLALRKPLCELLPRLRSYEGVAGKFSFGDRLAETEESVDRAVGGIDEKTGPKQLETREQKHAETDRFSALVRDAETNPSYVILAAWEQLAAALDDLVGTSLGTSRAFRRDPLALLRELQEHHIVNSDFIQAMRDLRDLRNRVAHGRNNPTSGEAVAYIESARELSRAANLLANLLAKERPTLF